MRDPGPHVGVNAIVARLEEIVADVEATVTHATVPEVLREWDRLRRRLDRIQANPVTYRDSTLGARRER
jgi:hypothetical protein